MSDGVEEMDEEEEELEFKDELELRDYDDEKEWMMYRLGVIMKYYSLYLLESCDAPIWERITCPD